MPAPRNSYLFLAFGVAALSQSGNLVRIGNAPPVVMAAWRLLLASLMLLPLARGQWQHLRGLKKREMLFLVLAGASLAAHLIAWIAAVQHTTIANATIFYAINPVLTATAAYFVFGERMNWRLMVAIFCGLLGIAAIGWRDLSLAREHLYGDLLALLCSFFFTAYFLCGKRLRQKIPTEVYVTVIYAIAGVMSLVAALFMGLPAFEHSARNWICFLLLALVPTMIGHTSLNHALRHIDAGRVSTATLAEPPMAGLVAYLAWGERVGPVTIIGYLLISLSVLTLILDRPSSAEAATDPEV